MGRLSAKLSTRISSAMTSALSSPEQIEMQLAEYHKLARKLKLIPVSAEHSKGHDFTIQFNPEAGPNCLVKYRTQIKVRRVDTQRLRYHAGGRLCLETLTCPGHFTGKTAWCIAVTAAQHRTGTCGRVQQLKSKGAREGRAGEQLGPHYQAA